MLRVYCKWALTGVWAVLASAPCQAADRGVPVSHGIANFGQINDHLCRGAQPDAAGLASLQKLGVKTIICLRMPNDLWAPEKAETASNGITFINVPLKGVGRPEPGEVARVLSVIDKSPGPVFVHCEHGCDRTGTIIACYRIEHDHWTGAQAQQEADHYGMSSLERGMKSFIADFAGQTPKKRRGTPHQQSAKFRLAPPGALAKLNPCARRFIPEVSIPSPTGTWTWCSARPSFLTA
jgi:protein tyrosine phosphatase (PTP) superfamily phosphohydrolase (DUF442 family)